MDERMEMRGRGEEITEKSSNGDGKEEIEQRRAESKRSSQFEGR
jgi:hypothetical protein